MLYIDPVECIDCGACVPVCPVSAIFALDDLPEKWKEYAEKNAKYFGR
jgi:ferredoxin